MLNVPRDDDEKTWNITVSFGQILFKSPCFSTILYSKVKSNIYSKPHMPILLTVCTDICVKNVIKCVKSVQLLNVKLLKELNMREH